MEYLLNKEILLEDLEGLLSGKVPEGPHLEYKRGINLDEKKGRAELCKDVSSFSNAEGGVILIGIQEKKGTGEPEDLTGIPEEGADNLIERIENIIRDGIHPRVFVHVQKIEVSPGRIVLAIKIPQSLLKPHWIDLNRKGYRHKFYIRAGRQSMEMTYDQIRRSFLFSHKLEEQIKEFVYRRVAEIKTRAFLPSLRPGPLLIFHFIPLSSFTTRERLSFADKKLVGKFIEKSKKLPVQTFPMYTLEGLLLTNYQGERSSYSLLFREGITEDVFADVFLEEPSIEPSTAGVWGAELYEFVSGYLIPWTKSRFEFFYDFLGMAPPFLLFISLAGVRRAYLFDSGERENKSPDLEIYNTNKNLPPQERIFNRDDIFLPPLVLSEKEADALERGKNKEAVIEELWLPVLDILCNASKYPYYKPFYTEG